jgi:hypothetical protein
MLDHIAFAILGPRSQCYGSVLPKLGAHVLADRGTEAGLRCQATDLVAWPASHRRGVPGEPHRFATGDCAAVDAFFQAAVDPGAEIFYKPSEWPQHHPGYYTAYVRDRLATTRKPCQRPSCRPRLWPARTPHCLGLISFWLGGLLLLLGLVSCGSCLRR